MEQKNNKDYGFYLKSFESAVEVEDAVWEELIEQCSHGKVLQPDENGYPVAVEHVRSDDELAKEIRVKRNILLSQSDWTQLQDARLTDAEKTSWQVYRQALRDIPQQQAFPKNVVWPILTD